MPTSNAKLVQTNYDRSILAADASGECCYCLTLGQVRAIMGLTEQWTWKTRWYSPSGAEIDTDAVQNFGADLFRRLMVGCGETQVILRRINPETGQMEMSTDGGVFWTPDPEDPRTSAVVMPPAVPLSSPDKCGAAMSINIGFSSMITQLIAQKNESATDAEQAAVIASVLTGIFGTPVGAAITLIFGSVVSWLISADAEAMAAAFTEITFDQLRCALFCTILENGTYDDASFAALLAKVGTDVSDAYAKQAITGIFTGLKPVGLNNWAAQRYGAGADCSDCSCDEGCDLDAWEIQMGTLVSRTDTEIVVRSVLYGGSYTATIHSNNPDIGCSMYQPAKDGAGSLSFSWGVPPEDFSDDARYYPHTGIYSNPSCVNAMAALGLGGSDIGNVTFTVGGDCE